MEHLLADTNWLIRLERELQQGQDGPAVKLAARARIHLNPVSHAEFLSRGFSQARQKTLSLMHRAPVLDYVDSTRAGDLRRLMRKKGKTLLTPDAFMAATALRHGFRLVTADKDFSGIPGLRWSAYRAA